MRKQRILIVAGTIALLLMLGALLLLLLPGGADEPAQVVFALPAPQDVLAIHVSNAEGAYKIVRDGNSFRIEGWVYDMETDEAAVRSFADQLLSAVPDRVVTAEPTEEQLADFALLEPRATVEILTAEGATTLLLGRKNGITDAYYARLGDGAPVYILSGASVAKCMDVVEKLVHIRPYKELADREITAVTGVRLYEAGELKLELRQKDLESEHPLYEMVWPFSSEVNWSLLHALLLEPLQNLEAERFFEGEAAQYGLAEPAGTLCFDLEGEEIRVDFSEADEDGNVFMLRNGDERIYVGEELKTRFVTRTYLDILGGSAYVRNISEVEELTVSSAGETYHIFLQEENGELIGLYEGSFPIDRLSMMDIYGKLAGIPVIDNIEEVPEGETMLTAGIELKDGGTDLLELVSVDERHCAVVINGEARHITLASYVKWIGSELQRVTSIAKEMA